MSETFFYDIIHYYSICDEIYNESDHAPIIMSLKYDIERKTILINLKNALAGVNLV